MRFPWTGLIERTERAEKRAEEALSRADLFLQESLAAQKELTETKEAAAELVRVVASSPMIGAPGAPLPKDRPIYAFDEPFRYFTPQSPRRRPDMPITIEHLRGLADTYDVVRSCIQHLKREVANVPLKVRPKDAKDKSEATMQRIKEAERWFETRGGCGGTGTRRSHFEGTLIEDLLVVGAAAVFYTPTRGGNLIECFPIDAATIRPRVDPFGFPGPDDIHFEQWIYGVMIAGYTRDQLFYDGLWPVTYSPFFRSPLEWLVNTVYAALKADEWNRLWLSDGNIPSMLLAAPQDWKPEQIQSFTTYFDMMLSGDNRARRKAVIVPGGTSTLLNPTKQDQEFQVFEQWLMQRTCSIFGVSPASIGFQEKQYKVSQEGSMAQTTEFGAGSLLEWRKALYDDQLCRLGYDELEVENVTSQEEDAKARAERNQILINSGQKRINEARADEGLDPVPEGDVLLVDTTKIPLGDLIAQSHEQTAQTEQQTEQGEMALQPSAQTTPEGQEGPGSTGGGGGDDEPQGFPQIPGVSRAAAGKTDAHKSGGKASGGYWVTIDENPVFIGAGKAQGSHPARQKAQEALHGKQQALSDGLKEKKSKDADAALQTAHLNAAHQSGVPVEKQKEAHAQAQEQAKESGKSVSEHLEENLKAHTEANLSPQNQGSSEKKETPEEAEARRSRIHQAAFGDQLDHLSEDHIDALDEYGISSEEINAALRSGKPLKGELKEFVGYIDDAIAQTTLQRDLRVFRGINLPKGTDPLSLKGQTLTDPAFISTTLSTQVASGYMHGDGSRVMMVMEVPKGTNAVTTPGGLEHEVLLGRNRSLQVTGVEKKGTPGNEYYRVTANLLEDKQVTRAAAGAVKSHEAGGKAAEGHWVTMDGKPVFIPAGALGPKLSQTNAVNAESPSQGKEENAGTNAVNAESPPSTRPGFRVASDEERKSLALPPAWTNVMIAEDPSADLIALGMDGKGRTQYRYSTAHTARQAAAKFARLKAFHEQLPALRSRIEKDREANDAAACLDLIARTGFRVGGSGDTKADEQAYGASTLTKEHVSVDGETVSFSFTGKKGVKITKKVTDPDLARSIEQRLATGREKLFATSDKQVRDYLHTIDGEFKVKDFRTWNGTAKAVEAIASMPVPKDMRAFEQARRAVATIVAEHLGNTPTVALESYIDPQVFSSWISFGAHQEPAKQQRGAGGEGDDLQTLMDDYLETVSFDREIADFWSDTDDVPDDDSPHAAARDSHERAERVDTCERELCQWERKSLNRLAAGKPPRTVFHAETIPLTLQTWIEERLETAQDAAEVKALFRAAKMRSRLPGHHPHERKSFSRLWQSRRIAFERAARDG